MQRREFMTLLGGAAATLPLAARAQQPAMPVIGFLSGQSPDNYAPFLAAFRRGLGEMGYAEGKNVVIEYRWAGGYPQRLPTLAADLVRSRVDVIAATGGTASGLAAKAATVSIPIVFTTGEDPVLAGLVSSLNRPNANVTGISWFSIEIAGKRLALLHDLVPAASVYAILMNAGERESVASLGPMQVAARALGRQLIVSNVENLVSIDAAFPTLKQKGAGALIVNAGPFFGNHRTQIVTLASRYPLPACYAERDFVTVGGLMSYGNDLPDAYRRNGIYVARILKGDKPADLPIDRSTKFELAINLKTAKVLGLEIPLSLLSTADDVIE
jgi:putative ABC transport system substrate-binding protein